MQAHLSQPDRRTQQLLYNLNRGVCGQNMFNVNSMESLTSLNEDQTDQTSHVNYEN